MTSPSDARPFRFFSACLVLGAALLSADCAVAQGGPSSGGAASLPLFARPQPGASEENRWAGSYARLSSGFEVSSSKHFGSYAGPTIGFEGGRMWQDGSLVYGVVGAVDYLAAIGGGPSPGAGGLAYSRDFSGALQVKVGTLLTPDVLLYVKAGAVVVHEKLRVGATSFSLPQTREDLVVRPDARVGVEWAVTDHLSVAVEAGMAGRGLP